MKNSAFIAVIGLCVGTILPARSTPVPYLRPADPLLVFDALRSDDCTADTTFNTSVWHSPSSSANGITLYKAANVAVTGGRLVLSGHALTAPDGSWFYTGAQLTSVYRSGYGYYELCAQMPAVSGWSVRLTLSGASNSITGVSFTSGGTSYTQQAGYVVAYNGINNYPDLTARNTGFAYPATRYPTAADPSLPDLSAGWHYFGVEWKPNEVVWYFDGVVAARTPYGGPDSPTQVTLSLDTSTNAPDGASLQVAHLYYWRRDYGVAPLSSAIVATPTDLSAHQASHLAFDHQVFDLNAAGTAYLTYPGAGSSGTPTTTQPLASSDPSNPVYQYFGAGDAAKWPYNGSAAAADVFVWNPAMFPNGYTNDTYMPPETARTATYSILPDGQTVSANVEVNQMCDDFSGANPATPQGPGQRWVWLGVFPFRPNAGYIKVAPKAWSSTEPIRAAALQYRQLNSFYDDFSSALTGWTAFNSRGTTDTRWTSGGGVLNQTNSSTDVSYLLRTSAAPWADHFVRAQVRLTGGTGSNASVIGRYQSNGDHYLLRLAPPAAAGSGAVLSLLRRSAGVFTTLQSVTLDPAIDPVAGYVDLHLFMTGTLLQALVNGELVLQVTDGAAAAITSAGQDGLRTYNGTASFRAAGAGQ